MIVFGGYDGKERLNDTWIFDTGTSSPPPLASRMCGQNYLILWFSCTDSLRWTRASIVDDNLIGRSGHTATLVGSFIFVFGGRDNQRHYLSDLHVLDIGRLFCAQLCVDAKKPLIFFSFEESMIWSMPNALGEGPTGRAWHSATLVGSKIIYFGGIGYNSNGQTQIFDDVFVLDTGMKSFTCCVVLCSH